MCIAFDARVNRKYIPGKRAPNDSPTSYRRNSDIFSEQRNASRTKMIGFLSSVYYPPAASLPPPIHIVIREQSVSKKMEEVLSFRVKTKRLFPPHFDPQNKHCSCCDGKPRPPSPASASNRFRKVVPVSASGWSLKKWWKCISGPGIPIHIDLNARISGHSTNSLQERAQGLF